MKQSWGNYFSLNNQKAAYQREFDALPRSYDRLGGTGKSIVAGIDYIATTTFDTFVALPGGTILFGVQNAIGYSYNFLHNATFVHKERLMIRKARFKIKW
ncbi:hypothetical protein [Leptospira licerasiae]|uniref:hypothetical protein n=1 Tax=Leptospira licerasiae TaxID=447106 RepID=UPI0030160DCB